MPRRNRWLLVRTVPLALMGACYQRRMKWIVCAVLLALPQVRLCTAQAVNWIAVGPAPQTAGDGTHVSGRVTCMAISSDYDGRGNAALYIGTFGGIWRSTNFASANPTWQPLIDHLTLPALNKVGLLSINSVAVSEKNPRLIYAVSGDPTLGLLRSTDGGNTWTFTVMGSFSVSWPIGKIVIDPTDASGNTVYVSGGAQGVYKTTTGGASWQAAVSGLPTVGFRISDLDYTVSSSQQLTLYAAIAYTDAAHAASRGIWNSTNGGTSWTQMKLNLVDIETKAAADTSLIGPTKLGADHSPNAPHGVFAVVGNASNNYLLNVFWFADSSSTGAVAGGDLPDHHKIFNQGVNLPIAVSPSGNVYLGTAAHENPFRSTDNGKHWTQMNPGGNNVTPHVDDWAWAFYNDVVYCGNDGGVWSYSESQKQWESLNTASLQTHMVNGVSGHPVYPNVLAAGSQDNETALRINGAWKTLGGGPADGGRVLFDPDTPNTDAYAYTWGPPDPNPNFFFRLDSLTATSWKSIGFYNDNLVPFYSVFSIVPSNTQRILVPLGQVFETSDRGTTWQTISPAFINKQASPTAVANSYDGQTIYVAYGTKLFFTTDGGGDGSARNWSTASVSVSGSINALAVDQTDASKIYLATSLGQIWESVAGVWSNISGNFPAMAVNSIAVDNDTGTSQTRLFLGTAVGVYSSSTQTGNVDWEPFGTGLPDVNVTDLHYNPKTKYLIAGTYGRGVFVAYLHFTTPYGLGSGSVGKQLYVFGVESSGAVRLNQATLGQSFSGWFDVQGGASTNVAPAATGISNSIFVFTKAANGAILLNQADVGHPFGNWFEVQGGGRTDASPAAATIAKTVFVFAKSLDNRILLNQADYGHAFGNWFEVQGNGRTDRAPSATTVNQTIFVFTKGLDNRIYLNQADYGHAFGNWFPVQGTQFTDQAPAAASVGQTIFVFAKGMDGRVYVNQADYGHAFGNWFPVPGSTLTNQAPSATSVGDVVFVFIRGLDGHVYVNQAELGHAFSGWIEAGGGLIP